MYHGTYCLGPSGGNEYFADFDKKGKPVWTENFEEIKPLIEWNNNMGCVTATYVPQIKKYLMCITDGWPRGICCLTNV